ncbi:MAG: sigma-70 family RNA polymerase sigma factor [candidate division Zixibacteria bacterium]|nr:sigma-70 family RNA polymerase sigma factor [candidate division Zixibacteria bacterium]
MSNGARFRVLIEQCLLGDETAWSEVVELVTPVILGVCRGRRLSREASLDIFGQVCFLLLKKLPTLKSPEKLLAFVATTTRWEIYAMMRRTRLLDDVLGSDLPDGFVGQQEPGPDELAEQSETEEVLVRALLKLPEKEAKLIRYLFLDENEPTYQEISRKLGIPVASIGPTRARGLAKLRRLLKKYGHNF